MVENQTTIRAAAVKFGISRSLTHVIVKKSVKSGNADLAALIAKNIRERHIRGGKATSLRYRLANEAKQRSLW